VNPLMVAGRVREEVDACLIDQKPVGRPQFLT
jgi:hypothetical protein